MVYLLNFNVTYIIILATCFDSYKSSSGILFYSFMSYSFCLKTKTVRHKTVKQYVQQFLKLMPEDDSKESKNVAKIIIYVILKLSKYTTILLCRRKYIVDLQ